MTEKTTTSRDALLERLSLVLVRPAYAGNVGAVARVMANFGVRRGILVAPRCDINSLEARQYATGPSAVTLATLQPVKTLRDSLVGATSVIGLTRRTGQLRKPSLTIADVASHLKAGPVTIVFGPEESGLSDEDIQSCTDILTLDVSETMPSLNLSHAVAVVLARIFEELSSEKVSDAAAPAPVSADEFLALFARLTAELGRLQRDGKISNAERMARILSQSLSRARLDETELAAWHGFISLLS